MRQISAIQETVRRKLLREIDPQDLGTCMSVFAAILANMDGDWRRGRASSRQAALRQIRS